MNLAFAVQQGLQAEPSPGPPGRAHTVSAALHVSPLSVEARRQTACAPSGPRTSQPVRLPSAMRSTRMDSSSSASRRGPSAGVPVDAASSRAAVTAPASPARHRWFPPVVGFWERGSGRPDARSSAAPAGASSRRRSCPCGLPTRPPTLRKPPAPRSERSRGAPAPGPPERHHSPSRGPRQLPLAGSPGTRSHSGPRGPLPYAARSPSPRAYGTAA